MNISENNSANASSIKNDENQRGTALVIAIFILALISVFVALALSRTSSEAAALGNETAEGRTFYAAQGSLEMMTRNFNKVFETKLNPTTTDLDLVRNGTVPGLSALNFYDFTRQEVDRTSTSSEQKQLTGGPFSGLYAVQDKWRLRTTVTDRNGIQIQLTRNILNNRIPIFQFGIFYDDDLELFRPPRFNFGGRVHTNSNFFISPGTDGVYFDSRVTAARHIITQTWRNWNQSDISNDQTYIKNASRVDKQLTPTMGSVLNTTAGASDNIFNSTDDADLPPSKLNPNWATQSAVFDGNLQSQVKKLKLPLNIGTTTTGDSDKKLIQMVERGKQLASGTIGGDYWNNYPTDSDDEIIRAERFANKTGIRVSLADSKYQLPGCYSGTGTTAVTTACGVMLDGAADGVTLNATGLLARGYQPKSMRSTSSSTFNYTPTRVNGERLYMGGLVTGRRVWIKVETVQTDATGAIVNKDITQDFLSMGVTEQAPIIKDGALTKFTITASGYDSTPPDSSLTNLNSTTAKTASTGTDSRSIIKLQRFVIPGTPIPGGSNVLKSYTLSSGDGYNTVVRYSSANSDTLANNGCVATCTADNVDPNTAGMERYGQLKRATVDGVTNKAIVPFPIEMFDTREGTFYDNSSIYRANYVTKNGSMSMIDIDVANLRRFLRGDFDGLFPVDTPFAVSNSNVGLKSTDIPSNNGWVLYVSDRRGDADYDGEYDMEDIYGYGYNSSTSRYYGCDGVLQPGEDVNKNGILDVSFNNEAPNKYDDDIAADLSSVTDLKFYRRGVRLINGTVIPGVYDSASAANTKGFTVATENGIYVSGNYNATGAAAPPSTGNTPYDGYLPLNTATHIPASIVADSVTILSNNWNDAKSFAYPYDLSQRKASETTIRFAMISGDTISSKSADPNQGGSAPRLNGGVHNFKRYLERWTDPGDSSFAIRLNYSGSLINLFNSRNNNGAFKCCTTVYNPPIRNWVFDSTFLDPGRLPPGTPFFQYVQTTGFLRTNE